LLETNLFLTHLTPQVTQMKKNEANFADYVMKESSTVCSVGIAAVVAGLAAIVIVLIVI